jgi:hypothetical protein
MNSVPTLNQLGKLVASPRLTLSELTNLVHNDFSGIVQARRIELNANR